MAINNVDRTKFIRLLSLQSDLESFVGKEFEWFSNTGGNVIGTIALETGNKGWNYVVLKRKEMGEFRACEVACNFYNQAAARVDCMFAMAAAG